MPIDAQESPTLARGEAAEEPRDSAAEPKTTATKDSLDMPSEFMAVRSVRLAAKGAISRSEAVCREIETNLKNHAGEFDGRQTPPSSAVESVSASLQQQQADDAVAVEAKRPDEAQKQVARMTQTSLEPLVRTRIRFAPLIERDRNGNRLLSGVFTGATARQPSRPGFMPFYAGPRLGGHCTPVDSYYLSWELP